MQKSIDSASVCLHKGDSCACLSSIVELFLGFLKEAIDCIIKHTEPKAADLFPIKASITFLVMLCWRKTMIRQSRVMRLLGMVIDRGLMILMPLSNMLIDSIFFLSIAIWFLDQVLYKETSKRQLLVDRAVS